MKYLPVLIALILALTFSATAQHTVRLTSPNGKIKFSLRLTREAPLYTVAYGGKQLINPSELGFTFAESGHFGRGLLIGKPRFSAAVERYTLPVGKASTIQHPYRQVLIPLSEPQGARRQATLIVRAFNDGLAFRYEFPKQEHWSSYTLTEERSTFNLADDPLVHTLFRENYTTSHEGFYSRLPWSQVKADTLMDMPTLLSFPGNIYMAVTEAALRDYAGMYLVKHDGVLRSQLSPLPNQSVNRVQAVLPHKTPWRVLMIGDRIGDLIASNILTSLNEPCTFQDLSWLKPGKTTFHWWNGDIIPDTTFSPGVNFETNKYYIDFCARNGLEYHSVIGYANVAWYVNDGIGYMPGPHSNVKKPIPGLDMQRICDYAKSKGVNIRVWVHWKPLYAKLDEAFAQFEKWGVKGMMVDFMDRDDQEMVKIQEEILQKAAQHHLHIQFHGAYKPTGMHRTYPNEFTREGTLNYENNKWATALPPDHDLNMPFTRLLAGAADYHLGGFRTVPETKFKPQYTRPLMAGTRCHMLAMYVVLESYLGMVCDYPAAYEGQPGFEFIKAVPVVWDETIVPAARVDEYVCIARRKGTDWYIGAITGNRASTVSVNLQFLPPGKYKATVYRDADDTDVDPNHLLRETRVVDNTTVMELKLAPGGGQAIQLTPA
jgi:alpha-glucosidase